MLNSGKWPMDASVILVKLREMVSNVNHLHQSHLVAA